MVDSQPRESMSTKRIIVNVDKFPIQPKDINAKEHLFGAFDHSETEISAGWIIRFFQERGQGWRPFSYKEIGDYYASKGLCGGFTFNRLVEPGQKVLNAAAVFGGAAPITKSSGGGWLVQGDDNKYYVTDDFVARCFKSSPKH